MYLEVLFMHSGLFLCEPMPPVSMNLLCYVVHKTIYSIALLELVDGVFPSWLPIIMATSHHTYVVFPLWLLLSHSGIQASPVIATFYQRSSGLHVQFNY